MLSLWNVDFLLLWHSFFYTEQLLVTSNRIFLLFKKTWKSTWGISDNFRDLGFLLLPAEQCSNCWETVHTLSFVCFSLWVWGGWQRQSALWAEKYSLQTDLIILKPEYILQSPRGIWKHDQCPRCSLEWLNQNLWGMQWHPTPVLLPGRSHGRRSLVGCSPWGLEESDTTERLHFHFSLSCIGEGNGNPLQCSCLENPRDRGARWAAVYGVAQSRTRLKWLSSSWGMGTSIVKLPRWVWWMASRKNHRRKQTNQNLPLESCWEGKGETKKNHYIGYRVSLSTVNLRFKLQCSWRRTLGDLNICAGPRRVGSGGSGG